MGVIIVHWLGIECFREPKLMNTTYHLMRHRDKFVV